MINSTRIDSLAGVDFSKLTFSDLRVMFGTGRSFSTGSGRDKSYTYRVGCQTAIGDIKEDVWSQIAEVLVAQTGEENILVLLIEYVKSLPWMKREPASKIKQKALELHMNRIFDDPEWVNFISFTEKWRPDALDNAEVISIIPSCCPTPGRITEKQIKRYTSEETIACPHCGRLSSFQRI